MPWEIVAGSGKCPSDKPFAVVKQADGELAGCHDSQESAEDQLAALYASESDVESDVVSEEFIMTENDIVCTGDDCVDDEEYAIEESNREQAKIEVGTCNSCDDSYSVSDSENSSVDTWSSVITVEGRESGDQRMFSNDALVWDNEPLPLMYQPSMLPGHDGSVLVGQIQDIKRDGDSIRARGIFDLGGPESSLAREAHRQVEAGILRGVSVDVDSVSDADVEYVYASDDPEDEAFWNAPSLMIVHKGRIRGATLTPMPAFVEAKLQLGDELFNSEEISAVIPEHTTEFDVESSWEPDIEQQYIPMNMAVSTARSAFAYVDMKNTSNGVVTRSACDFLHHRVNSDGSTGPANITACIAGIHKLNENLTYSQLPDDVRKGVYAHLRAHILEAGMSPSELNLKKPLVAAAHVITIHDVPPAEWFNEPKDVQMLGALTVTDEGRVYGLLGPRHVNHRSFPGQNVQVPRGNVDYSLFMGGETIVSGGSRVVTGAITMGCGHANTHPTISADNALEHYDNSCSVVANIRIGENAQGTWVAGAIVPGVTSDQIVRMMSCRLSGDWRPHSQKSGMYEFCGALLVPVPGLPMARKEASVTIREGALVASSIPVELIRASDARTPVQTSNVGIRMAARVIARIIGRDADTRKEQLRIMIHGE